MNLSLTEHLAAILASIEDPKQGLPQEIFYFISRLTPMINVDLLIKNDSEQTLLTWRADEFFGPGWHIPGGIIRFKEKAETRIQKVAQTELGATVKSEPSPIAINELFAPHRDVRGHFISLLYRCSLVSPPNPDLQCLEDKPQHGQWKWHNRCPDNLISAQEIFRAYF
ncbi:MAG: NUDIX hydrolase [Thiotrichaceae bacterium IS1]|nr:MAG: NUDIX hydrolase [Thiotrichaceae bacterium IS1]